MPARVVKFGFKEYQAACDPRRFERVLKRHMAKATELNGMTAAKALRETIATSRGMAANAALTVFIKGSSKPLVDFADLYGSQTYEVVDEYTVFAGVLKQDEEGFNLAQALHDGFQTKVTPAMRGMFFYLWKASTGAIRPDQLTGRAAELWNRRPGGWYPLEDGTTVITTPGRPWVSITLNDASFKAKIMLNWEQAIEAVFAELAGRAADKTIVGKAIKAAKKAAKTAKRLERSTRGLRRTLARRAKKAGKSVAKFGKRANRTVTRTGKKVGRRVTKVVNRSIRKAFK